jgi:phosphatidylglycerophosphate synthase
MQKKLLPNKLHPVQENPIDILLAKLANGMKKNFHTIHFTPNHITTLSLIFGLMSVFLLYKDKYILSVVFFIISYFFDVLDGIYARTYNMVTKFGDYYDHLTDLLTTLLYVSMIIYKCKNRIKLIPFLIILLFFVMGLSIHIGCQENVYNSSESETLAIFKKFCNNKPEQKIKYTRFFGCGTIILVICIIALCSSKIK